MKILINIIVKLGLNQRSMENYTENKAEKCVLEISFLFQYGG